MKETNYEFRKRLMEIHKHGRRDYGVSPSQDEVLIGDDWTIVVSDRAGRVIFNAARDLQDYLLESMGVSVRLKKSCCIEKEASQGICKLILAVKEDLKDAGKDLDTPRSYRVISGSDSITVCGFEEKGAAQGCYYLEDIMNLKLAPIVKKEDSTRRPVFSPRMVHSGYGLDMYPDSHLSAIAHSGMDSILVFAKDTDITPHGYLDFNELIYRAEGYGLDVYAYSYLKSAMHPDDPGAEQYYDNTYGKLFRKCPALKGVVMVGESVEFPSKDPRTSGKFYYENTEDGLPTGKPSPGWWPCNDYPQWLGMIKKVTRRYKPDADIVFWTYNWGYADRESRLELLKKIPTDISLLVTFEMFEKTRTENITSTCVDYTLSFEGPGEYFISEAEMAHERGIRLYTMSNTGGLTWDIGVIPYQPMPYQWIRRHEALHSAHEKWGLSGLMESHHYGWWPSFISEIAKWSYWSPSPSGEEICRRIAARDYGETNVEMVLEAWQKWSEGIRYCLPSNEDQYGPSRIGPSYPLVFRSSVKIPEVPYAMFGGNTICNVNYDNQDAYRSSLFQYRLPVEMKSYQKMEECFVYGVECLEKVYGTLPEAKRQDAFYLLNMGRFIVNCIRTTIHVKKWVSLKMKLFAETDKNKIVDLVNSLIALGKAEIKNAEETIPLVEADSRLGWEPSMEYMTDACHLRWKIRQVRGVLEAELPEYLSALKYQ